MWVREGILAPAGKDSRTSGCCENIAALRLAMPPNFHVSRSIYVQSYMFRLAGSHRPAWLYGLIRSATSS